MLKTRLIPCMLFNGNSVIKTINFSGDRTLGNPVQFAKVYNSRNVDELIFLDVDATPEGRRPLYSVVEEIVRECYMPLCIGGGIHSIGDISRLLKIGADKIAINSEAILNSSFITEASQKFGSQCIVVSIDVKRMGRRFVVHTDRGRKQTDLDAVEWAKKVAELGAGEILVTSIDRDGTMKGYDVELIQCISNAVSIPVIACGGAGKVQDVIDVVKKGGANAVSLASMFHYSGHTSESIKERMHEAGIQVRIA